MSGYPRVLVLEEDPLVLLTFTLELQADGFEVLGAANPGEAMTILKAATHGVTAAVIDLDGPCGGDPLALARAARALNVAMAVLYTSRAPRRDGEPAGAPEGEILLKPCPPKALAARVRGLLSA